MKKLNEYTTEEKIKFFDSHYQQCLEELNENRPDADGNERFPEKDTGGFWEGTIGDVLDLTDRDWEKHIDGEELS